MVPWWCRGALAALVLLGPEIAADRPEDIEGSSVESTFDFSQVSFAQPVADDDFEDAFYESSQSPEFVRAEEPDPSDGSCCSVQDETALRACANKTSPIGACNDPPTSLGRLVMVVSHAPRSIHYAAATAAMNAMWSADRGYPFVLDEREPAQWISSRVEVIPHWLRRCRAEGIEWMLWLDSDAFLLAQEDNFNQVRKAIRKYSDSNTQIMLTREVDSFLDPRAPWDDGNVGVMLLRCSEWTLSLIERVRRECLAEQKQDEDTLERLLYTEEYEAQGMLKRMPPQALNSMGHNQIFGPNASLQAVIHLNDMPFEIRNHTIYAAFRAHCDLPPGSQVNFTVLKAAFDSSTFSLASQDFREAGTSRWAFYMARRLKEQKRFQETEDLLRWAVDGLRTEIGEQKVDTLFGKSVLAKFLGSINRTEESLELFQNAVAMGIKVLGAHNPVMIEWHEILATLLQSQGRLSEAAGSLRQVVRGLRRWKEEVKVRLIAEKLRLVLLLNGTSFVPGVDELINETASNLPDAIDSIARQRLVKANEKSSKFILENNLNQAENALKRGLEKASLVLPITDADLLATRLNLGALKQRTGRWEEALIEFEEVYQVQASTLGPEHRDSIATSKAIVQIELGTGQNQLHVRYTNAMHKLSAATNRFLERTKWTHGRDDKSVSNLLAAIQKAEPKLGKHSQGVLKAKFSVAAALAHQGRSKEAFPVWRTVLQDQLRYLGPFHQDTLESLRETLLWIYQEGT